VIFACPVAQCVRRCGCLSFLAEAAAAAPPQSAHLARLLALQRERQASGMAPLVWLLLHRDRLRVGVQLDVALRKAARHERAHLLDNGHGRCGRARVGRGVG